MQGSKHPESNLAALILQVIPRFSRRRWTRLSCKLARLARQQSGAASDLLSRHPWVFTAPNLWRNVCSRGRARDQRTVPAVNIGAIEVTRVVNAAGNHGPAIRTEMMLLVDVHGRNRVQRLHNSESTVEKPQEASKPSRPRLRSLQANKFPSPPKHATVCQSVIHPRAFSLRSFFHA